MPVFAESRATAEDQLPLSTEIGGMGAGFCFYYDLFVLIWEFVIIKTVKYFVCVTILLGSLF